ncbi:hypothetical protein SAMN04487928_11284 [Butyrivibrio proteoclasticus]|uniref:Uncharacterized protein n=1 Tax=Butyrivibrio proteoclasticus TaxID=43305 RepID=A0A1I5UGB0_9FIRM|nr:hypothetical protein [Butyrivibrio proteoclasticus]SFP93666.1 hypothetical protein SAMN04487928_11284 [Butyrivibrio proteoclasticus]
MSEKRNMVICAAAREIGISEGNMLNVFVTYQHGIYEVTFTTEWMTYDMFIDENTMEVLGIDYRPIPINSLLAKLPEAVQDVS